MGAVYDEFLREMQAVRQQCAGDPRQELIELFLMALEREELVSIGYRDSLMRQRIAALPLPDDVKDVLRHALVWIWKDEEMHTIYIRGAILKIGSWWLRVRAISAQCAGGIGGWAGSVLQHSQWRLAPVSRLIATLVTAIGGMVGKVPRDVRLHLQYGPFRNFCEFNIDAEQTAAFCWYRIAELAASRPDLDRQLARDFRRVAEDEDRHAEMFRIIADALTDDDRLRDGVTVESVVERIRGVGEEYLPRGQRRASAEDHPIGSGAPVHSVLGVRRDEKRAVFRELLDQSGLGRAIRQRAAALHRPVERLRIVIKPTFMLGYHRKDPSPLTDPVLVDDLARYLRELGCADITVIEGRNIYDRFFDRRTVEEVARYLGFGSDQYRIIDTEEDQVWHPYSRGMAQYTVAGAWRDADFRISFPKLRSHPIEMALLCVGNIEWVGGRCDEYIFLERQADRATAVMMLLNDFPPHFGVVDAYEYVPDGLVGVMGSRKPIHPLRFYAGKDVLSVDTVVLRHVGVRSFESSSLLRSAAQWFGGSPQAIEVIGTDAPIPGWRGPYHGELRSLLSVLAYPVYVMGSCRGSFFVPEMDLQAFPLSGREGFLLKTVRRAVRWLLDLRVPDPAA